MKINELQKKIVGSILIISIVLACVQIAPKKANAFLGIGDVTVVEVVANTSPTAIQDTANIWMERLKNFVLDRLATAIADAILNQMTSSVINWINTGFKGSPSFMTNPAGFFMDAADQVTGQFIAETGILSNLCSPFSVNLRANIALGSIQTTKNSYTCTLKTITDNVKNIPNNITLNGQNVKNLNGQNIQNFMNGDFSQGGWPAFNTVMMDPQNDPYFAYQAANSDINASIVAKKNSVNMDLSMGNGFMSFKQCTPVKVGDTYKGEDGDEYVFDSENAAEVAAGEMAAPQNCTTQTPGSAISSSLTKTLGIPFDKLTLANNINAIINALISQMVMQVLGGGLQSMSSGSAGQPSYTSQIYQSSLDESSTSAASIYNQNSDSIMSIIQTYKSNYDNAVSLLKGSQSNLNSAKSCLTTKYNSLAALPKSNNPAQDQQVQQEMSQIQSNLSAINSSIQNQVQPLLSQYGKGSADGYANLAQAQAVNQQLVSNSPSGVTGATAAATVASDLQSSGKLDQSQSDLQNAQNTASSLNSNANTYSAFCNNIAIPASN